MRKAIIALLALPLAAALVATHADAGSRKKHKRFAKTYYAQPHYARSYDRAERDRGNRNFHPDGYFELDSNRLPFGSAIWWDQMQREGRLGRN